jgi:hypothetical protein
VFAIEAMVFLWAAAIAFGLGRDGSAAATDPRGIELRSSFPMRARAG